MEQKQLRIQQLSKFSYALLKIVRILMYMGMAALLVTAVFIALYNTNPSPFQADGPMANMRLPFIISINEDTSINTVAAKAAEFFTLLALLSIALYYAGEIFKKTRTGGSPFVEENIRSLKRTAFFMAVSALAPAITGLTTAAILGCNYEGEMNITLLVCALVLLWLAYVFDYGCALQLESDETL